MEARLPAPMSFEGNIIENFQLFKQNLEIYLLASGKDRKEDRVKVAICLNLIGDEGLDLFNSLQLTIVEKENYRKVLGEIEKAVIQRKNVVKERFLFHSRNQLEGETFDTFLTHLKKLSKSCKFAEPDSMIRDKIVIGIYNKSLQEKLLQFENLDLTRAIELCKTFEEIKVVPNGPELKVDGIRKHVEEDIVQNKRFKNEGFDCFSCDTHHVKRQCPAYGKKCPKCSRYNHFEKMCRTPAKYAIPLQSNVEEVMDDDDDVHNKTGKLGVTNANKTGKADVTDGNKTGKTGGTNAIVILSDDIVMAGNDDAIVINDVDVTEDSAMANNKAVTNNAAATKKTIVPDIHTGTDDCVIVQHNAEKTK